MDFLSDSSDLHENTYSKNCLTGKLCLKNQIINTVIKSNCSAQNLKYLNT